MRKGNLFVISGPSGVGKGTLMAHLLDALPHAWMSVSATTREPRPTDRDGIDYYFMSREDFADAVEQGGMLEWAEYSGNLYGTPLKHVEEHLDQGMQVILEIEVQGALQVKDRYPSAHLVFIAPPSLEELERRLRARQTDSEESIQMRLKTARFELSLKEEYDYVLVNDKLDDAVSQLVAYVNAQVGMDTRKISNEHHRA